MTKGTERVKLKRKNNFKERRPTEERELKEGNEKRKVKVEVQEDCILPRLLCALSPIPYLMDLV